MAGRICNCRNVTYVPIPHSMGGSTLDYDKVDKGVHPKEAIKTGG